MEDFFQLMIGAILFLTKFASFTWLKLPISSLNYETRNCHTYRYWHFIYKTTITYLVQERTMSHRGLMSRAAGAVLKLHHSPSIPCRGVLVPIFCGTIQSLSMRIELTQMQHDY